MANNQIIFWGQNDFKRGNARTFPLLLYFSIEVKYGFKRNKL